MPSPIALQATHLAAELPLNQRQVALALRQPRLAVAAWRCKCGMRPHQCTRSCTRQLNQKAHEVLVAQGINLHAAGLEVCQRPDTVGQRLQGGTQQATIDDKAMRHSTYKGVQLQQHACKACEAHRYNIRP